MAADEGMHTPQTSDSPFALDPELAGFAYMYGACRTGIIMFVRQKEQQQGRALRMGWPVLIAIGRMREGYYGMEGVPFGQIRASVLANVHGALEEFDLVDHDGADIELDPPPSVGKGRLDREVAGILSSWELQSRYGDPVALTEDEIRRIGKSYVEDAIQRMRQMA